MKYPFCKECGAVRPDGVQGNTCIPCLHRGHHVRLVMDAEDACRRLSIWKEYYDSMGYSARDRKNIPSYMRLVKAVKEGAQVSRNSEKGCNVES